jgi:F-type H+-transporting ATPase subunit alpha
MTGLPIVETKANDISAFIPTNVISITDGQCFLETDLFLSGVRPAVNVGTSVSRVGGAAQVKAMRQVSGSLRVDLAQFRDLEAFSAFASDLDDASKAQLARGQRMVELLKQGQYTPYPVEDQVVSIWSGTSGELDEVPAEDVRRFEAEFLAWLKSSKPEILVSIAAKNEKLSDETIELLKDSIDEFKNSFEKADGQLLRGDVAVAPLARDEVAQETITRNVKA